MSKLKIFPCRACGRGLSLEATTCPGCGGPNTPPTPEEERKYIQELLVWIRKLNERRENQQVAQVLLEQSIKPEFWTLVLGEKRR
jgi:hypothetical protein